MNNELKKESEKQSNTRIGTREACTQALTYSVEKEFNSPEVCLTVTSR